ncbi:GNAT family N-acetyltransferase [Adhaeribacter sp. BT258]|uniref:GNAT family N-acetyltransferase n=1 Tax=Adhaeribacter terrigena TaxID=2793070 RepID=A0ABS1C0H1_9BACT|nr:GNAT family N-acetyltransferase [Adhaeribacter terrigena]MBK0402020.1 GNAT family N-acetyltransferase [Adhaeribacter terrigena]
MQLQNNRYLIAIAPESQPQEFAFDPFLFLRQAHLQTQAEDEQLIFQLLDQKTNKIAAHLPFFLDGKGLAYSPGKAPFGSVQFKKRLPEEVLAEFLLHAKRYLLEQKNCRNIQIKSYPFAYATHESAVLTDIFLKQGFRVSHSEINHHIAITEAPFETKLHPSARRRLHKCVKNGFAFQEEEVKILPEVWNFIRDCRLERNYEPPMPLKKLAALFQDFPQDFRLFSVRHQNELAAATIAVRINGQTLYNFYPANPLRFNAFSPVVFLTEGLYEVCQQEYFETLDLGTSNLPTGPNFPLIAFKKHLGGEPTLKLTFEFNA